MDEEYTFPINFQSKDGEEYNNPNCISDAENSPDTWSSSLNKLDICDLNFTVKGIHLLNGCSNEILDKIVACKSSSNKMINGDQFHEETMQQMVSEALTDGRVKLLGGASLQDYLKSLAAGRVRFIAINDPAELGIK